MRQELATKRAAAIRGMFARIAHRYDLLNRLLSAGQDVSWRRRVARRAAAERPRLALDVCTGTGDLALALVHAGPVIASDFCLPMVTLARTKAATRGCELPLVAADALRLPLRDGVADVVTVAFGVRNFEDLDAGLGELARVLRPGGLLLVLEFSRPRGPLAPVLAWWARHVPPRVGRAVSGDSEAYSYLPASVGEFPDRDAMCARLEDAGLVEVRAQALTSGVATLYEGRTLREDG